MISDTLSLAFLGSMTLLLGALALAGGLPFYPQFLLLYSLAFLCVSLMVYAGTRWGRLRPQMLYVVSTLTAAGIMLVCLAWVMKNSFGKIIPLSFLLFLGTVLLPYLTANGLAYLLVVRQKA